MANALKLPYICKINKIIVYGSVNNLPELLIPLKIELYNDDVFLKYAIKENCFKLHKI